MSTTDGKVKQLRRIERLRRRMHEISAWRVAALARERADLIEAHAGMLGALADGIMAYGPPSVAGTRRVRALERELAVARAFEQECRAKALDEGRLAKIAEMRLDAAHLQLRQESERKSLEELIDATLGQASRKP